MKVTLCFGTRKSKGGGYEYFGDHEVNHFKMKTLLPIGSRVKFNIPGRYEGRWTYHSKTYDRYLEGYILLTRVVDYCTEVDEDTSKAGPIEVFLDILNQEESTKSTEKKTDDWRLNMILEFQTYRKALERAQMIELRDSVFRQNDLARLAKFGCETVADVARMNWKLITQGELKKTIRYFSAIEKLLKRYYNLSFAA